MADDILEVLIERHRELTTPESLEAVLGDSHVLIDCAEVFLHSHKDQRSMAATLCAEGLAHFIAVCLATGIEIGQRSTAPFAKPH